MRAATDAAGAAATEGWSDADAGWTLLTNGGDPAGDQAVRLRRIVVPLIAAAVVVAGIVAVAGLLVGQRIAEQQAVHDVAQTTDVLAANVIQPALTDVMLADPAVVSRRLGPIVKRQVLGPSLLRVKLWRPDGTVLYSDAPALVGERFPLEPEARKAFASPRIEADISDLDRPENRLERSQGKLLEVYRPVWTPNGSPLLFETYFRYSAVTSRSHQLWRGFGGVMLSSLAALLVLMAPLVWVLFARARRARAHREALMRLALQASQDERRRIAGTLHDGVVQQLAAVSFTAAGTAERAAAAGQPELAADLGAVASTVRDGIAGLRSLLVEIYPPSLHTSGLAAALRDLVRTNNRSELDISTDIDDEVADALSQESQEAAFGVAQEALRNAVRHSGARDIVLALRAGPDTRAWLTIDDDGRGFEATTLLQDGRPGHFGLRLMTDVARRGGARLSIASAAGRGTRVLLEVART